MLTSLFAVVAITLLVSAMCSLFEATLYSTRIATLEAAREEGRNAAAAEHFLRLKRDIGVPTSAILILNTVANTTGATLAGMLAGEAFGSGLIGVFSAVLEVHGRRAEKVKLTVVDPERIAEAEADLAAD